MINIKAHSGIYTLSVEQKLPLSIEKAWDFFSSPHNLAAITPKHMGFHITSDTTEKMYPGQIISYKVSPLLGIKMNWVTEITHVEHHQYFVDEQRFGPYLMWHHEHHFQPLAEGILMRDKVSYKLPAGALGRLFHPALVQPQLKAIFEYRYESLDQLFT
ncbi:MAG: SRPBCC family protein [Chitinophagales bacterium]